MKKCVGIIMILMFQVYLLPISAITSQEKMLRDSIFRVYRTQSGNEAKHQFLRSQFYKNIGQKWVVELLDSSLAIVNGGNELLNQIHVYSDYYMYYKYQTDLHKMEYYLNKIKEVSYKNKNYNSYFQLWNDILQFYNIRGSSEYVRLEALRMREEAKQLGCQEGVAYSYLVMARSLNGAKKYDEAIEMYRKVLDNKYIKKITRSMVYSELATLYQECGKPEKSLAELDMQRDILKQIIRGDSASRRAYRENILELELSYCAAYYAMGAKKELLNYLNEAKKFYSPNCFISNFVGYHLYWGGYYCLEQRWDECFKEFDIALAHFDDSQPLFKRKVCRMKGQALVAAGRHEEAARLFKQIVLMGDTINTDMLASHERVNQTNYLIRNALLQKEQSEKYYNGLIIGLVLMLIIAMVVVVLRARLVYKLLHQSELETRAAMQTANDANKLKDVFLRNIVHEIRIPLNTVVGFSELLATERDLSFEQIEEYSLAIKRSAKSLSQLIVDVLDLSRLESGMMKYNVQENDIVQLCKDAKMMVEMQEGNSAQIEFQTVPDHLSMKVDSARFMKLLSSVMSVPDDVPGTFKVKLYLTKEENAAKIIVTGAPLFNQAVNLQTIQHDINRLYLKAFNGTYQLEKEEGKIVIIYPVQ